MINDVQEVKPLFSVQLELYEGRIRFLPSLRLSDDNNLLKLIENILNNIYHIADTIPRVYQPPESTLRLTFKGN